MADDTSDPVAVLLQSTKITQQHKADLWDAFYDAADADDLARRLSTMPVPRDLKAQLWDLKGEHVPGDGAAAAPSPASPMGPSVGAQVRQGVVDALRSGAGLPFGITPDFATGVVKEAGRRAVTFGRVAHMVPGVDTVLGPIPDDAETQLGLDIDPTNRAQRAGQFVEQAAEYLVPAAPAERVAATIATKLAPFLGKAAPTIVRAGMEALTSGAVTAGQGGDVATGAVLGAAGPITGAATMATGRAIGRQARPLGRAAIKPMLSSLKRIAGAGREGLDAKAEQLVQFILDNRLTTPEQATAIIEDAERRLSQMLADATAPTDMPARSLRYLTALERSARKQGLAAADVATLRNATAEVLAGGLGTDEVTMVLKPHSRLLDAHGKPLMVLQPETARVLRTDVSAAEAMDRARATSRWQTRKAWGEQKGTQIEAHKAVERAGRDAAKATVPEARATLQRESHAIRAREALDRMRLRQGNREVVGLPEAAVSLAELQAGRVPFLTWAENWLRKNQLRAGIYANDLRKAIDRKDKQAVGRIMTRIVTGAGAASTAPAAPSSR